MAELIYGPWPIRWAYWALVPIVVLGLAAVVQGAKQDSVRADGASTAANRRDGKLLLWAALLPVIWLGWQFFSATQTVDPELTGATLPHFVVCVVFFYLGLFGIRHPANSRIIWVCLTMGLACVLRAAFDQHFGGLESTRKMVYATPGWEQLPPLFLKRLASNRVFGTLFYANSLAGAILLVLPIAVCLIWAFTERFSKVVRWGLVSGIAAASIAALFWSGSKAGWLLAVVMSLVALWQSGVPIRWKRWLTCAVLVLGLAIFGLKHAGFFQKGATSAVARYDYWTAAVRIAAEHPVLGTGPGTFQVGYRKLKAPDAEMSKLCHNDFLQQACDSGLPGAAAFTALWGITLGILLLRERKQFDLVGYGVCLGLLGYCLHSFVEFHLYIPALSWTVFFLLGWAWSPASRPGLQSVR